DAPHGVTRVGYDVGERLAHRHEGWLVEHELPAGGSRAEGAQRLDAAAAAEGGRLHVGAVREVPDAPVAHGKSLAFTKAHSGSSKHLSFWPPCLSLRTRPASSASAARSSASRAWRVARTSAGNGVSRANLAARLAARQRPRRKSHSAFSPSRRAATLAVSAPAGAASASPRARAASPRCAIAVGSSHRRRAEKRRCVGLGPVPSWGA